MPKLSMSPITGMPSVRAPRLAASTSAQASLQQAPFARKSFPHTLQYPSKYPCSPTSGCFDMMDMRYFAPFSARPEHKLDADELERLDEYIVKLGNFLDENYEYAKFFSEPHATLICDGVNLKGTSRRSFNSLIKDGILTHKTWKDLLPGTKQAHEDFLKVRDAILRESSGDGQ